MISLLSALLCLAVPLADDPKFNEGVRLYEEFEFEEAALRFEEASLGRGRSEEEHALLAAWLGMAYANAGRFDEARASFTNALRRDPDLVVPREVSPKVLALVDDVRRQVRAELAAKGDRAPDKPPVDGPPSATTEQPFPWLFAGAGASAAAAALAAVGGAVATVLMLQSLAIVTDPDAFYDDAYRAQADANLQAAGAIVGFAVAGVLFAAAAGMAGWAFAMP